MRSALELIEYYRSGKMHPNEIFDMYEEFLKLPSKERYDAYIQSGIGDAIDMSYITAVEMKKNGTWEAYLEEWEKNKHKTPRERLIEYARDRGIEHMLKIEKSH